MAVICPPAALAFAASVEVDGLDRLLTALTVPVAYVGLRSITAGVRVTSDHVLIADEAWTWRVPRGDLVAVWIGTSYNGWPIAEFELTNGRSRQAHGLMTGRVTAGYVAKLSSLAEQAGVPFRGARQSDDD